MHDRTDASGQKQTETALQESFAIYNGEEFYNQKRLIQIFIPRELPYFLVNGSPRRVRPKVMQVEAINTQQLLVLFALISKVDCS